MCESFLLIFKKYSQLQSLPFYTLSDTRKQVQLLFKYDRFWNVGVRERVECQIERK